MLLMGLNTQDLLCTLCHLLLRNHRLSEGRGLKILPIQLANNSIYWTQQMFTECLLWARVRIGILVGSRVIFSHCHPGYTRLTFFLILLVCYLLAATLYMKEKERKHSDTIRWWMFLEIESQDRTFSLRVNNCPGRAHSVENLPPVITESWPNAWNRNF